MPVLIGDFQPRFFEPYCMHTSFGTTDIYGMLSLRNAHDGAVGIGGFLLDDVVSDRWRMKTFVCASLICFLAFFQVLC